MSYVEEMTTRYAHFAPDLWHENNSLFRVKTVGRFHIDVIVFIFTSAVVVTPTDTDRFYIDRWCYTSVAAALKAADEWSGEYPGSEPSGWHRHPDSGRRREAGDSATEYVQL